MSNQRSIIEIIDEMLGVIPADQTEFIARLDLLVHEISLARERGVSESDKNWQLQWERLGDICEECVGEPTQAWHFQLASVIFNKPVAVLMEMNNQIQKEMQ